jgi:ribosomal protein L37AE/L43A
MKKILQVRIPEELYKATELQAKFYKISVSQLVRRLLLRYLDKMESMPKSGEELLKLPTQIQTQIDYMKGVKRVIEHLNKPYHSEAPRPRESATKKHKEWQEAVFMRDNYTCQHCGNTDVIEAHHIKSKRKFPDLRFDVNNGITLCSNCHKKIEGKSYRRQR